MRSGLLSGPIKLPSLSISFSDTAQWIAAPLSNIVLLNEYFLSNGDTGTNISEPKGNLSGLLIYSFVSTASQPVFFSNVLIIEEIFPRDC